MPEPHLSSKILLVDVNSIVGLHQILNNSTKRCHTLDVLLILLHLHACSTWNWCLHVIAEALEGRHLYPERQHQGTTLCPLCMQNGHKPYMCQCTLQSVLHHIGATLSYKAQGCALQCGVSGLTVMYDVVSDVMVVGYRS